MKSIHNILSVSGRFSVIQASDQPFPNSGGEVVAFPNCQLSIVNYTSSPSHSKFSALCSKFSYSQGFLYAPFGEITTEYNANFGSDIIPKYSFNAKELDEETGMYYYEARYYKPPVFTSRDPMFEKYFWMTPYAYCANNPVKYVDPSGSEFGDYFDLEGNYLGWDGNNDGKIYFITDDASISKIKANNNKENGTTNVSNVNVFVSTSKQVVLNILRVHIMTIENGDNREFAACITRGTGLLSGLLGSEFFRGEKCVDELQDGEAPSVYIPKYENMEASIHSHPGKYAKWSALDPSDDDRRIQAGLNVITGRIDFEDGMQGLGVPIYGAVFYNKNWKQMFSIGIEKLIQVYGNAH